MGISPPARIPTRKSAKPCRKAWNCAIKYTRIALLKAKDIAFHMALCFQLANLLADELKARQGAAQFHAVLFGNRRCHIGGNNGGHGHGILGHGAAGQACAADIIPADMCGIRMP